MTKAASEKEEKEQRPELEIVHWLPGGAPLFVADKLEPEEIIDEARTQGFSIFYLLAETEEITEHKGKNGSTWTTSEIKPRIVKVTENLIGNGVAGLETGSIGLKLCKEEAYFTLPKIPWDLIHDIDDFFREVDRLHKTEAVVIFTYDPAFKDTEDPSAGWGVLVPKQTNTAGSCDYDPTSVVDDKPDDVYIVGSAHSHPGMAAFCSGTDARDQADFDGIHITYGWKTGARKTDFHIELQMAGSSFVLKPEQAFTEAPEPTDNEKVKEWTKKVTKKTFTRTVGGYGNYYDGWDDEEVRPVPSYLTFNNLPEGCPSPRDVTLIYMTEKDERDVTKCPACLSHIISTDKFNCRCQKCYTFLALNGDDIAEIINRRSRKHLPITDLDLTGKSDRSIWVWEENEKEHVIYPLYDADKNNDGRDSTKVIEAGKAEAGDSRPQYLPENCPDPRTVTLVIKTLLTDQELKSCPACEYALQTQDYLSMQCSDCESFIMTADFDSYDEFLEAQHDMILLERIDPDMDPLRPIWVWEEVPEKNGIKDNIFVMYSPSTSARPEDEVFTSSDVDDVTPLGSIWMLCCDQTKSKCTCRDKISFARTEELLLTNNIDSRDIYGVSCKECAFYWDFKCIPYRGWLEEWWNYHVGATTLPDMLTRCSDYRTYKPQTQHV